MPDARNYREGHEGYRQALRQWKRDPTLDLEPQKIISMLAIGSPIMRGYVDGFVLAVPKKKNPGVQASG